MALDPESAAKLGKSLGKGLSDQVFGLVDDVRNAKAQRIVNNQKIAQKNTITEINNQVVRQNNALREQAMREIAAEQERAALAKMTISQRQEYFRVKAEQAKEMARVKRLAEERHEEIMAMIYTALALFIIVPIMVWFALLVWGAADITACFKLRGIVPLISALCH